MALSWLSVAAFPVSLINSETFKQLSSEVKWWHCHGVEWCQVGCCLTFSVGCSWTLLDVFSRCVLPKLLATEGHMLQTSHHSVARSKHVCHQDIPTSLPTQGSSFHHYGLLWPAPAAAEFKMTLALDTTSRLEQWLLLACRAHFCGRKFLLVVEQQMCPHRSACTTDQW